MKLRILTIFLIISLFSLAFSQQNGRRIEPLLRRLDQQLTVAADLFRHFPDTQAGEMIRQAEKLKLEGQRLYANNKPILALAKLDAALDMVARAINILSRVPLQRIQEQVEELLRRGEQLVPGARNNEAERLLQQAIQNRRIASQAVNARDYRKAIEHYRIAKFLGEKCLSLIDGANDDPMERLQREKSRYEELFESAREIVSDCENPKAAKLLQQAEKQNDSINRAIENGNLKAAQTMYYSTQRLLLRAIDMCRGGGLSTQDLANEEVELFQDLIAAVQENTKNMDPRKRLLLNRATDLYQQARNSVQLGHYEEAILKVGLGRNVLNKIWQKQQNDFQQEVRTELDRLQNDIKKNQADVSSDPRFSSMLNAASNCAQDAERLLFQGRTRLSLLSILAGNRFIETIENNNGPVDSHLLTDKLQTLRKKISEFKTENENDQLALQVIKFSENMANRAEQALINKNYSVAAEYISLGNEMLDKVYD
ncbi:hypothetical protein JW935_25190 [candidate division KSB1 bacterium]|nr:hypothetical protein [candidate division KSB1 bacterium]